MPEVTLTKALGGNAAGDTLQVTNGVAAHLTSTGAAERTEQPAKRSPKRGAKAESEAGGGDSSASAAKTAG